MPRVKGNILTWATKFSSQFHLCFLQMYVLNEHSTKKKMIFINDRSVSCSKIHKIWKKWRIANVYVHPKKDSVLAIMRVSVYTFKLIDNEMWCIGQSVKFRFLKMYIYGDSSYTNESDRFVYIVSNRFSRHTHIQYMHTLCV